MADSASPNQDCCVVLDGVTKSFGAARVLDNVDLRFPSGTISAIVGESGSGKSTLLQHVNGLLQPDQGTVSVFDQAIDYDQLPALRQRIGYAVQGIGLFPHLSGVDNIDLLARLRGWDAGRRRERREHLLEILGLDPQLATRFPHEMSGGQQQRIGLCRAMMLQPTLLLLDEPFSGVDPITRAAIHERLLDLHAAEPVSMLLVTHDMNEARALATHLSVLRDGRVLQSAALDELAAHPVDAYVARLLSVPS